MKIKEVKTRKILNSQGLDALEIELLSNNNIKAISSAPSAIIPGKREVITYNSFQNDNIKSLISEICSNPIENQIELDDILGTYIEKMGSKVCLPFSLAFARIMAKEQNISLVQYISKISQIAETKKSPIPLVTIFSGGVHNKKDSIQNIMIAVDIHPFSEAVPVITKIYTYIENILKEKNLIDGYGASSGMIVERLNIDEKFRIILNKIKEFEYEKNVSIAIDVAAEHFFHNGLYIYNGKETNSENLYNILSTYIDKYNITYIEDPFDSTDEKYWKMIKQSYSNIAIVGDDLFATQEAYINNKLANGIVIKMNQVGTLTQTINAVLKAKKDNMVTCVSHRSIETEDTFMCDLAVALNSTYIKIGGPRRGDRISKYNRLLRLEEMN